MKSRRSKKTNIIYGFKDGISEIKVTIKESTGMMIRRYMK
jgi:hypothetical protein